MAKCIECKFYITAEETGDKPGCMNDGDVSNPNEDINCVEGGDGELEDFNQGNSQSNNSP